MKTLGISAYFHDSAAALVCEGRVVAAAQEERFSRVKHDAGFPKRACAFVLDQANLSIDDIDRVVFYENPLRKFERIVVQQLRAWPRGFSQFSRSMSAWLGGRLWLKADIAERLGVAPEKIVFGDHHLSHAASVFLTSGVDDAAVVTVDGVGEAATTTIFHGQRHPNSPPHLAPKSELHFPHSIGLLYSALTAYLGFEVNEGEYKVMGLAAYGRPRFLKEFHDIATIGDDGSLVLDLRYFSFQRSATKSFTRALENKLGPARKPDAPLVRLDHDKSDAPNVAAPVTGDSASESQRFADVAASLQAFTELYLLSLCREAKRRTGSTTLCLAGGVALNSVAIERLTRAGLFERIFVHPAAGDAGGALGAALHEDSQRPGRHEATERQQWNLGAANDTAQTRAFLSDCRIAHTPFEPQSSALFDAVASRLAAGEVGGWCEGRAEWGPRALGHRSILADPRSPGAKERVNAKIKFREAFRPFAPAVLEEEVDRWFVRSPLCDASAPRRTMSTVAVATDAARAQLPAVVHVDQTSRLQTVTAAASPTFHRLLRAFKAHTGVGVLLNTSLNLRGEPMCQSAADALALFFRSDLDFIVVDGCLIERMSNATSSSPSRDRSRMGWPEHPTLSPQA